ncbi:MAG: hypothetical protein LBD02_05060 [Christensenellaceae bacterium]|jgi:hypothetical protein|nr:hypothetical protein [Christensenellaceae bacterium]
MLKGFFLLTAELVLGGFWLLCLAACLLGGRALLRGAPFFPRHRGENPKTAQKPGIYDRIAWLREAFRR